MAQLVRIHLQHGRPEFNPWVGKVPWRREKLSTPVFCPGEFRFTDDTTLMAESKEELKSLLMKVKEVA